MGHILLFIQLILATTLILAAIGKISSRTDFINVLKAGSTPRVLIHPIATVVPVFEVLAATALVLLPASLQPLVLSSIAGVFALFTVWLTWLKVNNPTATCGCFGKTGERIGIYAFLRNGLLIITSFTGVILATQSVSPLQELTLWGSLLTIILLGSAGFVVAFVRRPTFISGNTGTNGLTALPRRAFLARAFAGIVAVGAAQLGIRTVYAQSTRPPCDCSGRVTISMSPDCSICDSLCNRCPPSPCNVIFPATRKTYCREPDRSREVCRTETVYMTAKCC